MTIKTRAVLMAALLCAVAGRAIAAEQVVPEDATPGSACVAETNDAKRLACYDKAHGRLPPNPKRDFGLSGAQVAKQELAPAPTSVTFTVVRVLEPTATGVVLALDNGQVWEQIESSGFFPVKPGDQVTVKPGALGSFFLTGASGKHRGIRVKRIK